MIAEGGVDRLGEPPVGVPPAEADVVVGPGRDRLERLRLGRLGEHVPKIGEIGTVPEGSAGPAPARRRTRPRRGSGPSRSRRSLEMARTRWQRSDGRPSRPAAAVPPRRTRAPVRPRAAPRPPCAAHRCGRGRWSRSHADDRHAGGEKLEPRAADDRVRRAQPRCRRSGPSRRASSAAAVPDPVLQLAVAPEPVRQLRRPVDDVPVALGERREAPVGCAARRRRHSRSAP